jgi:hypothetical protein
MHSLVVDARVAIKKNMPMLGQKPPALVTLPLPVLDRPCKRGYGKKYRGA